MKIRILRGYAVTMLSRTFNSYICGFHYFRRYWSPEKAEKLICLREENNAFDVLAIKTCKEYGMIVGHLPHELSQTRKFILSRGARILTVLTSWLINRASRSCVQWVSATYRPWFFFGWWNWSWMCIKWDLKNEFSKSWKKKPDHMTSETCFLVKMKQTRKGQGL